MDKSFSCGHGWQESGPQSSPATITICGVRLGAGDNHWATQV